MQHRVTIVGPDHHFLCSEDRSVLAAMLDCGRTSVAVGCRSGGCGVCRVEILDGHYRTGQMSSAQVSPAERLEGFALACQLFPAGALVLRAAPRRNVASDDAVCDPFERMRRQCAAMAGRAS